ncbi:unnamed protein product [Dovyalis caffra]|uniref:Uncharacterized protein n=1 Tax=Dovyalis caffra TaxID=77055 RepID=A0AAV1RYD1_9ROSI|nr:unnamed protein product [Dovyalis caffra]
MAKPTYNFRPNISSPSFHSMKGRNDHDDVLSDGAVNEHKFLRRRQGDVGLQKSNIIVFQNPS